MISYESSYSILIGHRIRNERIALGMTQSEFAKLLGISPSYLGALERGTRPVSRSIMNRLHEKTHISYDYLLEGLEKPDDTIPIMQNIVAEPEHYRHYSCVRPGRFASSCLLLCAGGKRLLPAYSYLFRSSTKL